MDPGWPYVGSASSSQDTRFGSTIRFLLGSVNRTCGLGAGACPIPLITTDVGFGLAPRNWTTLFKTKFSCDTLSSRARNACDFPSKAKRIRIIGCSTMKRCSEKVLMVLQDWMDYLNATKCYVVVHIHDIQKSYCTIEFGDCKRSNFCRAWPRLHSWFVVVVALLRI